MSEPKISREEYRKRLLAEKRRTVRTVRNTLLAIAVLAVLWWFVLLIKERAKETTPIEPTAVPAASPVITPPSEVPSEVPSEADPAAVPDDSAAANAEENGG